MKKFLAILAMICLILGTALGGTWVFERAQKREMEQQADQLKQENPLQVDVKALNTLGLEPFVSDLPVMMIDTRGQQIFKESTIRADVAVLDDASGVNDIQGMADDVLIATVKYRGASSYAKFDKPQYRIKFYREENGKALDYDLFGLGPDSEWVLNGPFLDRTLLRNYLIYTLSGQIMDWAPSCTFFELFVNGSYQGVYLAVEPVTSGPSRLNLSEFGLLSGATPYIVKRDRVGTEENVLMTYGNLNNYTSQELSVDYPGKSRLTEQQRSWIERDISQFEETLYSDHFADPEMGYAQYIDVDSFVEYFIINEFAMNNDAGKLSTYAYKDLNGKIKLCVWDFNNAFDNYQWFEMDTQAFCMEKACWFDRLLQDRAFVDQVVTRYQELRSTTLSDAHIEQVISDGQAMLSQAAGRNFALWGFAFSTDYMIDVGGEARDPRSYDQAMTQLRATISDRLAFLDANMGELRENCIN